MIRYSWGGALALLMFSGAAAYAEESISELETATIEVVGTTPLPGLGTPVDQVPANVQVKTGEEIETQKSTNVGEFLEQNLTSVTVNNGQNNPFQPDLSFRGLTASPLLGTPQGLGGLIEEYSSPVYATAVGLVMSASQKEEGQALGDGGGW